MSLERDLDLLATEIAWPATPDDLRAPDVATIATPGAQARRRRLRLAAAIALGVLALAAAALAATGVIHFGGATIARVDRLPPVDPAPSLALGEPVTLAQARGILPVRLPPRLRAPAAAYRRESGLSFLYLGARGPRAVLTVLPDDGGTVLQKLVDTSTAIRRVRVQGAPALYIAGVHVVDFLYGGDPRLSQPTLLWVRGGLTYRLEARDALALASVG